MEYRKFDDTYYLRLDIGDEVISSITQVCENENITLAGVQGIGGCKNAVTGVYNLESKSYSEERIEALLEIVSLIGNITEVEGKPFLHAHAVFAYKDDNGITKTLAGHLLSAVIGLTGEIIITPQSGSIGRKVNDELGIKTWDFN